MKLDVEYSAISDLENYVAAMPDAALTAARIALNDVAEGEGLALYKRAIEQDVNFPPGYVNDKRFGVTNKAKKNDLAVTITARFRATSLARFAEGASFGRQKTGVRVQVERGKSVTLRKAFLVKLKAGNTAIRDNYNVGLAIRLKPGETLHNTRGAFAVALDKGLYLLYGPSIDQVFREAGPAETPEVLKRVDVEFNRQFFVQMGKVR